METKIQQTPADSPGSLRPSGVRRKGLSALALSPHFATLRAAMGISSSGWCAPGINLLNSLVNSWISVFCVFSYCTSSLYFYCFLLCFINSRELHVNNRHFKMELTCEAFRMFTETLILCNGVPSIALTAESFAEQSMEDRKKEFSGI